MKKRRLHCSSPRPVRFGGGRHQLNILRLVSERVQFKLNEMIFSKSHALRAPVYRSDQETGIQCEGGFMNWQSSWVDFRGVSWGVYTEAEERKALPTAEKSLERYGSEQADCTLCASISLSKMEKSLGCDLEKGGPNASGLPLLASGA